MRALQLARDTLLQARHVEWTHRTWRDDMRWVMTADLEQRRSL